MIQETRIEYVHEFKKTEEDFVNSIKNFGKVSLSSPNQDVDEHWDVKLEMKFDVKAIKKLHREDTETDENFHWVEIKNVQGMDGWLYGLTDYFAFETNDYWILVEKKKLQDFISEKCKNKEWVKEPALHKLYRREKRKDVITLVKTIDLVFICDKMVKKC